MKKGLIIRFVLLTLLFSISSCGKHSGSPLQGYIEGEYIYVSSNVAGQLLEMNVVRGQTVNLNDTLFKLDPEPEKDILEAAKATIQQLQAQVAFDKTQWIRQQKLIKANATDQSTLDRAETDFLSKTQQLNNAIATADQNQWSLQQKTVRAPLNAMVADIYYRLGENVAIHQPVLSLLAPRYIRVLFYVPEPQLSQLRLGQEISFACDSCKEETHARISFISPTAEYTPPIIYSQSTRYKLVYLIRAEMPETVAIKFHPGQPIDVYLND